MQLNIFQLLTYTDIIMADFNDIIKDSKPTLVDFFATWCGPCKLQGPILEEVKNKLGDSVNILKVDVDQNQELYQISAYLDSF